LLITPSVGELGGGNVEDPLAGTRGYLVDEPDEVLVGISESHATANTRLEIGGRSREVERDHALVLVPDVDHPVEFFFTRGNMEHAQQLLPVGFQIGQGLVHLFRRVKGGHDDSGLLLVDDLEGFPFFLFFVLSISQGENEITRFPRFQFHFQTMGCHWGPTVGHAHPRFAFDNRLRFIKTVVEPEETLPVGVITLHRCVDRIPGIMVAPFPVFGLMINDRSVDLYLSGREIALEILHVGGGIPKRPFDKGK